MNESLETCISQIYNPIHDKHIAGINTSSCIYRLAGVHWKNNTNKQKINLEMIII
jgi:hypothetical protein